MHGEFTAEDIMLWLHTSAFKKRARTPGGGVKTSGEVRRERIMDEVRRLQQRNVMLTQ